MDYFLAKEKLVMEFIFLSNKICRIDAMPSSLHKEKNGKVSDEGTVKKANGFNAEGPTTIKKRKSKKWHCCIGRSGASQ